jgi:hypothetical protein
MVMGRSFLPTSLNKNGGKMSKVSKWFSILIVKVKEKKALLRHKTIGKLEAWLFKKAYKKFDTAGEYIFKRCSNCNRVLVRRDWLKTGCCPKCGGTRRSPTNLSFFENLYFTIRIFI